MIGEAKATVQSKPQPKRLMLIAVVVLCVLLLGLGAIYLISVSSSTNPESSAVESQVRRLILVDPNEEPTIAKIVDIEKIRYQNPTLYNNVVNGDYLVIFSDKAIIYRPANNILINVLPVTASTPTGGQ